MYNSNIIFIVQNFFPYLAINLLKKKKLINTNKMIHTDLFLHELKISPKFTAIK